MTINNLLAVVTVGDFDAALTWYERLFGRPADRFPMAGLAEWQLTSAGGCNCSMTLNAAAARC